MKKEKNYILHQQNSGRKALAAMLSMLPYHILGSFSTTILLLVDGLVVGNYLGSDALNSVNLIAPIETFIGTFCGIIGTGISVAISQAMVSTDRDEVKRVYKSAVYLTLLTMLLILVTEVPVSHLIIRSYPLDDAGLRDVWSYSYGLMVSFVVGVISTSGTYILSSIGQAKKLAVLALVESLVNLFFDILFVGYCGMGVAGAGYGTAIAASARAVLTVVFLVKRIRIFPLIKGPCRKLMISICGKGMYRLSSDIMLFLKNYFINILILQSVGEEGYSAYSVALFAITITNSFKMAIIQSGAPLNGMMTGIGEWKSGTRFLTRSLSIAFLTAAGFSLIIFFVPQSLFALYRIQDPTELQLEIVRVMSLMLPALILNGILQNYMTYCKMKAYASVAVALQYVVLMLPLSALLIHFTSLGVFISFAVTNILVFVLTAAAYIFKIRKIEEAEHSIASLDLTVEHSQAADFSQQIYDFFFDIYKDKILANRLSVCAEEATAYVKAINEKVSIDLAFRAFKDHISLFVLNDGKNEAFIDEIIEDDSVPIANNYFFMRKLADRYSYHNICGLNSYTLEFLCVNRDGSF